ncbi:MAG: DUF1836 domain-containing protein [bacterium]|nr:DUF1836 domain-containing protein [bacterium]
MKRNDEKLEELFQKLDTLEYISPSDIPNIDLYMDQVTTFMETHLASSRRYPEDKILTKTMINNYAKNNLLPPPNKKRYSKEHMLFLIFIYYFKNLLSIHDIEQILKPISTHYFSNPTEGLSLEELYCRVFSPATEQKKRMKEEIAKQYEIANSLFSDLPEEERDRLQTFAFICELSYDVCLKKMLIEQLVDELPSEPSGKKGKN